MSSNHSSNRRAELEPEGSAAAYIALLRDAERCEGWLVPYVIGTILLRSESDISWAAGLVATALVRERSPPAYDVLVGDYRAWVTAGEDYGSLGGPASSGWV